MCAYKAELQSSVRPINFQLDPIKYNHCGKCAPDVGIVGGTNVSHISGNLVDLENDLRGQTRPLTRCPEYESKPLDGNTLTSADPYKCTNFPVIDISKKVDLPSCSIVNTKLPSASEPTYDIFKCNNAYEFIGTK
jgi:hypothetical protein